MRNKKAVRKEYSKITIIEIIEQMNKKREQHGALRIQCCIACQQGELYVFHYYMKLI